MVDSLQTYKETFEAFSALTQNLMQLRHLPSGKGRWSSLSMKDLFDRSPRVALLMSPSEGPSHLLSRTTFPDSILIENPFKDSTEHQRNLTLYIPVASVNIWRKSRCMALQELAFAQPYPRTARKRPGCWRCGLAGFNQLSS